MSTITRIKPYQSSQHTWQTILANTNIIPMNQRKYEWKEKELNKFMKDLFYIYEDTSYFEKMGTLIYYTGNPDGKEVWDGQQRLITIILTLIAISNISKLYNDIHFSNSIFKSITEDLYEISDVSSKISELIKLYGEKVNIPKIQCICPHDDHAISSIFNNYKPLICYKKNNLELSDDESDDGDENADDEEIDEKLTKIECVECNISVARKSDFIRHLVKKHNYDDTKINSKTTGIYQALEFICEKIIIRNYSLSKLKEFRKFISQSIDIQVCECNDLKYVSMIFDQENNRGLPVKELDVIKNKILSNIDNCNKDEIFDIWSELKSTTNLIYTTDFGQKIFNIAIQIYTKKIVSHFNQEELFDHLITKNNKQETYNNIKHFFKIVKEILDIFNNIVNDRYGRLINTRKCSITWEGFMYLLLPICYFKKSIDTKLIEVIVKWYYRNVGQKTTTFNSLAYSNPFIDFTNSFIKDSTFNYIDAVINLFKKEIDGRVDNENYIINNTKKEWRGTGKTQAKMLLSFLETKLNNDDNFPILEHDLEHIIADNKKNDLVTPSNVYKLGNLTLFESKNSENGHKGNRSVKDNHFNFKKIQYENSSHKITRDLCKLDKFDEETIINRTIDLFKMIDQFTKYDL